MLAFEHCTGYHRVEETYNRREGKQEVGQTEAEGDEEGGLLGEAGLDEDEGAIAGGLSVTCESASGMRCTDNAMILMPPEREKQVSKCSTDG